MSPPRRPFRFGLIDEHAHAPEALRETARRAEAAGYATFLLRDHFVPDFFGDQLAPVAALMAVAAATRTLRVGSLVFDNDYRHPVLLAKEAATLDLLSGGRLELGLGAGWLRGEYEQAGLAYDPPGVRIGRLEEALRILKGLFADGPVTFEGAHYRVTGLEGFPKPAQRPHPPIQIGGGHPRILRLAGREADTVGILTTSVATGRVVDEPRARLTAAVREKLGWVSEGAGGRWPALELSMVVDVVVTDRRPARTETYIADRGWQGITPEEVWDMPAIFIGSVGEIVEQMQARRETLGFSYYVVSDAALDRCAPVVARLAGR